MVLAVLGLVPSLGSSPGSRCEGAGIARYLTAQDRSKAVFLSETGLPISARAPTSSGSTPAYVAFPLLGGEHLPGGVPTVTTGPQAGETPVGPLDLNPLVQANLNAGLDASKMAIVQTPTQSYAVEYLPRYGRSQEHAASSTASSTSAADSGQTASSSSASSSSSSTLSSLESSLTIEGIPASELAKWVKTGSNGLLQWTSTGLADLENALHLNSKKATAKKAGADVAAQYLTPPLAESSPSPLPAPAPEPSTWLVFGAILGAVGLRQWAGKAG
jgi:hypothetical protein